MTTTSERGYLLSAVILVSVAVSILGVAFMSIIASASQSLNNGSYSAIAKEAADAGVRYALSCLKDGTDSWSTLTPKTLCTGAASTGSDYVAKTDDFRSTFSVAPPDSYGIILSSGKVEILRGSVVVKTYRANAKTVAYQNGTLKPSTGNSLTDIAIDHNNCAIANGELYCWGADEWGELGQGGAKDKSSAIPIKVQRALAGKTITKVAGGSSNVCAIADGIGYCWGDNTFGQVGNNTGGCALPLCSYLTEPVKIEGVLKDKYIQDISQKATSWVSGVSFSHAGACAVSNGSSYCWGASTYGEAGIPGYDWDHGYNIFEYDGGAQGRGCDYTDQGYFDIWTLSWIPKDTWTCTTYKTKETIPVPLGGPYGFLKPEPVYGYSANNKNYSTGNFIRGDAYTSATLYGVKADRVLAGAHTSCQVSAGKLYCWGVRPPLSWINSSSIAWLPTYEPGYASGLVGKIIDPTTMSGAGDMTCFMANFDYACLGISPAFRTLMSPNSIKGPSIYKSGVDIQVTDIGVDNYSQLFDGFNQPVANTQGTVCQIANGRARCAGTYSGATDIYTVGRDVWGNKTVNYVNTSDGGNNDTVLLPENSDQPGGTGLKGYSPTAINSGERHSCLIANGMLFCWGTPGWAYFLPNGDTRQDLNVLDPEAITRYFVKYPTLMAQAQVGTQRGTIAANTVSTGDGHSCGVANGQLYCWGKNDRGQLGNGSTADSQYPVNIPFFNNTNMVVTKVSVGTNSTCAIANGHLYCWGDNTDGKLGINQSGATTPYASTPQEVSAISPLSGKRISDISVGDTSACAVANGQAYCWGNNSKSQLGNGSTASSSVAVLVNNSASDLKTTNAVYSVSVGKTHACAVSNGSAYCWGDNTNGRTGLNLTSGTTSRPKLLTGGSAGTPTSPTGMTPYVSSISAGGSHTCAVINSMVSCWGLNTNGQLGTGNTTQRAIPTQISNTYYATQVSAGANHTCALLHGDSSKTKGNLYCWGSGADYRLGNGATTATNSTPVRITGGDINDAATSSKHTTTTISAGESSTCSVTNGRILCWGDGSNFRLGDMSAANNTVPTVTSDYRLKQIVSDNLVF